MRKIESKTPQAKFQSIDEGKQTAIKSINQYKRDMTVSGRTLLQLLLFQLHSLSVHKIQYG